MSKVTEYQLMLFVTKDYIVANIHRFNEKVDLLENKKGIYFQSNSSELERIAKKYAQKIGHKTLTSINTIIYYTEEVSEDFLLDIEEQKTFNILDKELIKFPEIAYQIVEIKNNALIIIECFSENINVTVVRKIGKKYDYLNQFTLKTPNRDNRIDLLKKHLCKIFSSKRKNANTLSKQDFKSKLKNEQIEKWINQLSNSSQPVSDEISLNGDEKPFPVDLDKKQKKISKILNLRNLLSNDFLQELSNSLNAIDKTINEVIFLGDCRNTNMDALKKWFEEKKEEYKTYPELISWKKVFKTISKKNIKQQQIPRNKPVQKKEPVKEKILTLEPIIAFPFEPKHKVELEPKLELEDDIIGKHIKILIKENDENPEKEKLDTIIPFAFYFLLVLVLVAVALGIYILMTR